jgi:hypothetical protein
LTWR